jgi:PKD repeat protein
MTKEFSTSHIGTAYATIPCNALYLGSGFRPAFRVPKYLHFLLLLSAMALSLTLHAQSYPCTVLATASANQNLRDAPSTTTGSVITSVAPGQYLVANGISSGWYSVAVPCATSSGYHYLYGLGGTGYLVPTAVGYVTVQNTGTAGLFIRTSAGSGNVLISSANAKGWDYQQFACTGSTSTISGATWYQIYLPNNCSQTTGWMSNGGTSSYLSYTPACTAPSAPASVNATAVSSSSISVSWGSVSGATSYSIYCASSCLGSSSAVATSTSTSYTLTGLSGNTTYYTYVKANSSCGSSSYSSCASATTPPAGTAPATPTGLSATAGSSSISLSWNAVTGATGYDVYSCSGSPVTASSGTSTTITGLTPGNYYDYKVRATNSYGTSAFTSCAGATIPAATTPPTAAFSMSATGTVAVPVALSNTSSGVPAPTYNWASSPAGAIFSPSSSANSPTVTFPAAGTYTVSLTASNTAGNNTTSKTISIAPASATPVTTVTSPAGFEAWQVGSVHNITGTLSPGASAYELQYSTDNGNTWTAITYVASPALSISYSWTVPNTISNSCLMKLMGYYNGNIVYDYSNAVFSIIPACLPSATSDYPPGYSAPFDCNDAGAHVVDAYGFWEYTCTSWTAWKVNQLLGHTTINASAPFTNTNVFGHTVHLGNAGNWYTALRKYFACDNTPSVGAIAWYNYNAPGIGAYGHVAIVNCVSGSSVTISEYNGGALDGPGHPMCTYGSRTIDLSAPDAAGNRIPTYFIHTEEGGSGIGSDDPTGIAGTSQGSVKVYPNPTRGSLSVSCPADMVDGALTLSNLSGQVLITQHLPGKSTYTLDLSALPDGLYVLSLSTPALSVTQKVEVMH